MTPGDSVESRVHLEDGMGQLVEFPLQDGRFVLVEVSHTAPPGGPVTRGGGAVSERAQRSFEDAVERVEPAAQAIITRLRGTAQTPHEVHVEFGLNLNAEVGAFITSASGSLRGAREC